MNLEELKNKIKNRIVKIKNRNFDESYLEPGMLARVIEVFNDNHGDIEILLEFKEFADANAPYEAHDWYGKDGKSTATMREAGSYPMDDREKFFYTKPEDVLKDLELFTGFDIKAIPAFPQRQDSLTDQVNDLINVATRLGMHDAADYLTKQLRKND